MHVGVDKSRSYISAAKGMDGSCVSSGARGMHAGDHRPNDSNIGGTNLPRNAVNQLSPRQKNIKGAVPLRSLHCARARSGVNCRLPFDRCCRIHGSTSLDTATFLEEEQGPSHEA